MYSYLAYGLGIQSELPLPELVPGKAKIDVVIRLGKVAFLESENTILERYTQATAEQVKLFYKDVGRFLVQGGREIIIDPLPGVEEQVQRQVILGAALGILLHQRGVLALHSSAIAVNGNAVAFLGESGEGKSTTAAAFYSRGYPVVADDVVAVEMAAGYPMVFPGFPRLKLWQSAAVFLGEDWETLPQLHPNIEKRGRYVTDSFSLDSIPLARIYVLESGESRKIELLQPQQAFKELMRHSYMGRFLQATGSVSSVFRQCVKIANYVPICRLSRPRELAELPAIVEMVEADVADIIRGKFLYPLTVNL